MLRYLREPRFEIVRAYNIVAVEYRLCFPARQRHRGRPTHAGGATRVAAMLGIFHRQRFYQYAAACGVSIPALRIKNIVDTAGKLAARSTETA
jgi:hypothetical protein